MVFTPKKMEEKMDKFEKSLLNKFENHKEDMKAFILNLFETLKDEIKSHVSSEILALGTKVKQLESDKAMLQSQITELKIVNSAIQENLEELEQYGRKTSLRINGIETSSNETSNDVLEKVVNLCKDSDISVDLKDIDRAHRVGLPYVDKVSRKNCKSIIVKFISFKKRTEIYQ